MLPNSWNTRGRQSDAKAEYAVSKRELVRLEVKDTSDSKVSGTRERDRKEDLVRDEANMKHVRYTCTHKPAVTYGC